MCDMGCQLRSYIYFFMLVNVAVSQDVSPELQPTMSPISSPTMSSSPFLDEDVGNGKGNEDSEDSNAETMSPVTAPTLPPTSAPIPAPTLEPTWAPIAAPTLQPTMKLYYYGKGKGSNKSYDGTCYTGEHHCPCRHIDNATEGTCDSGFVCDEHDHCRVNHTCYHLGEHFCPCTDNGTCDVGLVCDDHYRCHLNHTGKGKGNVTNSYGEIMSPVAASTLSPTSAPIAVPTSAPIAAPTLDVIECYIGSNNCPCTVGGFCDPGFRCNVNHTCMEDLVHNLSGYNYLLSGQGHVPETVGYVGLSLVVSFFLVLAGYKLLKMYAAHKNSYYDGVDMEDVKYVKAR